MRPQQPLVRRHIVPCTPHPGMALVTSRLGGRYRRQGVSDICTGTGPPGSATAAAAAACRAGRARPSPSCPACRRPSAAGHPSLQGRGRKAEPEAVCFPLLRSYWVVGVKHHPRPPCPAYRPPSATVPAKEGVLLAATEQTPRVKVEVCTATRTQLSLHRTGQLCPAYHRSDAGRSTPKYSELGFQKLDSNRDGDRSV